MQTPFDFLERTKSAVEHLLDGINEYIAILNPAAGPILVGIYKTQAERGAAMARWIKYNQSEFQQAQQVQRDYMAEQDAMGVLCGSLLQIAAVGVERYGRNQIIPGNIYPSIKAGSRQEKFCTGRLIRNVQLGLVIYAARNQYNHLDELELHKTSTAVMNLLATEHDYGPGIRDPAYDMQNRQLDNYLQCFDPMINTAAKRESVEDPNPSLGHSRRLYAECRV
ncbi:hypothetical protein CWI75_12300 [Kineobactrum sediminis]|uniref:Uncharacterized protein n=1 Tax=Kineobactrum sediminis TaxID=1905677 RepID=A0A2N5Y298_9GAMM|nr:hypothetical protein [Kineobactrum sediminis]PLW82524.1 hypothetical protein CWI75_12300 [Kineobactrum sediminis]